MIKKMFLLILLLFTLSDCKKSNDQVPYVAVNFYIYLNEPSSSSLNTVGNWIYHDGGYKGIILYRKTLDGFAAYDRTCPYDPYVTAALVEVDSSGLALIDRHCGSQFNILDGSVTHSPASTPLKQYAADFDGANIVRVHN